MPRIIVSYRRSDSSATAGRIYDHLRGQFGSDKVFMDVDAIPFGTDFRSHIKSALLGSDVLLAVIGPGWLGERADGVRRIDDEADPVRVEIETALANAIPVVPVLIDGAPMPGATDLPDAIRDLAFLNAAPVDMGRDFRSHMDRLAKALFAIGERGRSAGRGTPIATGGPVAPRGPSGMLIPAAMAFVLAAGLGLGGWLAFSRGDAPAPRTADAPSGPVRTATAEPAPAPPTPPVPSAAPAPVVVAQPVPLPVQPPVAQPQAGPQPVSTAPSPQPAQAPAPAGDTISIRLPASVDPRRGHGGFVWHELWTTDAAAAQVFYRRVMGWDAKTMGSGASTYTTLSSGGALVAGLATLPATSLAQGARPGWFGYVSVANVDASAAEAKALGGTVHLGPADIPGIGRYALIADPQGAAIVLFRPVADYAPPAPAVGTVSWRELEATDRTAAATFYGKLLGWTGEAGPAAPDPLAAGPETIGAIRAGRQAAWTYALQVDGLDAAMARVTEGGGRIAGEPRQGPAGTWSVPCTDPQGAAFSLVSRTR